MTMGVFSPVIIFPVPGKLDFEADERRYIMKHELQHIKSGDLLIKFLALFALAVHWYNPICYLLFHELCVVIELDCDYGVTNHIDEAQRRRYGNLILDLAASGDGKKERFAMKRCFALVISLILVLSLAACGRAERTPAMEPKSGSSSPSPVSGSAPEQPSQAQTDGPQTAPAEDLLSIAADFAESFPYPFSSPEELNVEPTL